MADPNRPRKFMEEFRRQIAQLNLAGKPRGELMAEYNLGSSTFSRWIKCYGEAGVTTEVAARTPEDERLIEPERAEDPIAGDVIRICENNCREYGEPKIKRALAREGIVASRHRIKRMMNQKGLVSAYARKKYKPRAAKASEAEAPNVLDREFDGYPPHIHIVNDLTYVRVDGKWNCVCLLIDLHNREIVGHAARVRKDARLVRAAFATLGFR